MINAFQPTQSTSQAAYWGKQKGGGCQSGAWGSGDGAGQWTKETSAGKTMTTPHSESTSQFINHLPTRLPYESSAGKALSFSLKLS